MKGRIHILLLLVLLILPVRALQTAVSAQERASSLKLRTVVIDPGHGGKDPGCVRNGIYEKDIVLSVALKLGKMIQDSLPGVRVIYTRSTDRFVELQERAEVANKNNADLFLSIHVNANKSSSPQGSETFCMGLNMSEDNMEVCQMENNVITLEDDYTSKYEGFDPQSPESYIIFSLLQNAHLEQSLKFAESIQKMSGNGPVSHSRGVRQAGFVVLWRCTSPAVLTELGFLTNDGDYKILTNKKYHNALAANLFRAIRIYRDSYEFSSGTSSAGISGAEAEKAPHTGSQSSPSGMRQKSESKTANVSGSEGGFAIQILSSPKLIGIDDPELKGVDCYIVKVKNSNKYVTGHYKSQEEARKALPEIRKLFPDAFVVYLQQTP